VRAWRVTGVHDVESRFLAAHAVGGAPVRSAARVLSPAKYPSASARSCEESGLFARIGDDSAPEPFTGVDRAGRGVRSWAA